MALVRWDPIFPSLSENWIGGGWVWPDLWSFSLTPSLEGWPSMDVYSEGDDLVIKVELPGVRPEDVNVSLGETGLTISGRQVREEKEEGKGYYRRERFAGSFSRVVPLPEEVREEDIEAVLEDGILRVTVRGAGKALPARRRIPITAA
jgi:HSP20 family protein